MLSWTRLMRLIVLDFVFYHIRWSDPSPNLSLYCRCKCIKCYSSSASETEFLENHYAGQPVREKWPICCRPLIPRNLFAKPFLQNSPDFCPLILEDVRFLIALSIQDVSQNWGASAGRSRRRICENRKRVTRVRDEKTRLGSRARHFWRLVRMIHILLLVAVVVVLIQTTVKVWGFYVTLTIKTDKSVNKII